MASTCGIAECDSGKNNLIQTVTAGALIASMLVGSVGIVEAGGRTRIIQSFVGVVAAGFISGAVSGIAAVEFSERYKARREFKNGNRFVVGDHFRAITKDGTTVWMPPGHYKIYVYGENEFGTEFVVLEAEELRTYVYVFLEK